MLKAKFDTELDAWLPLDGSSGGRKRQEDCGDHFRIFVYEKFTRKIFLKTVQKKKTGSLNVFRFFRSVLRMICGRILEKTA
jgi:hypothetical protein